MASSTTFGPCPGRPEIHPDLQDVAHQVDPKFADWPDPPQVDECLGWVAAKLEMAKVCSLAPRWFDDMSAGNCRRG